VVGEREGVGARVREVHEKCGGDGLTCSHDSTKINSLKQVGGVVWKCFMIKKDAKLSIRRVSLRDLCIEEVGEPWTCYPDRFNLYLELLQNNPDLDTDPLMTRPSPTHGGMLGIKNGRHRFLANIMAGRRDTLCIVIEGDDGGERRS